MRGDSSGPEEGAAASDSTGAPGPLASTRVGVRGYDVVEAAGRRGAPGDAGEDGCLVSGRVLRPASTGGSPCESPRLLWSAAEPSALRRL